MVTNITQRLKSVKVLLLLMVVSLFITNCNKPLNVKWVYYDETYCADKWNYTNNNEALKDNIVAYCKSKGIKIFELEIFNTGVPETCKECTCKTGRRVKAKIRKSDLSDIKQEGFYE